MIAAFGIGVIVGCLAFIGGFTVYGILEKHYSKRCEDELNNDREVIEERHRACAHNLRNIAYYDEEEEGEF